MGATAVAWMGTFVTTFLLPVLADMVKVWISGAKDHAARAQAVMAADAVRNDSAADSASLRNGQF